MSFWDHFFKPSRKKARAQKPNKEAKKQPVVLKKEPKKPTSEPQKVLNLYKKGRLRGVDPRLIKVVEKASEVYPILVVEGLRSFEKQKKLVSQGKSKTLKSKHLDGLAVDLAPYVGKRIDWNDSAKFYFLAGLMFMAAKEVGVKIRFGGDWNRNFEYKDNSFQDLVHFELDN